ncbi:MAG TPA: amino acid synthesis family protein, partial [Burkholderiales bacterium]|nr:amino acid synthesis family protein [Burkholderiales bacterium]
MVQIRKWQLFVEEILANETGQPADGAPLRKIAVAAVLQNPYAGRFSEDLSLLVNDSPKLGNQFGRRLVSALGGDRAYSYGKACIVGVEGEYEHGNALL